MLHDHANKFLDNAHYVTYGSAGSSVLLWGLHLNDIGVLVSMFCALCGLALQFYMVRARIKGVEKRQDVAETIVGAVAASNRATATKAAVADAKVDTVLSIIKPSGDNQ